MAASNCPIAVSMTSQHRALLEGHTVKHKSKNKHKLAREPSTTSNSNNAANTHVARDSRVCDVTTLPSDIYCDRNDVNIAPLRLLISLVISLYMYLLNLCLLLATTTTTYTTGRETSIRRCQRRTYNTQFHLRLPLPFLLLPLLPLFTSTVASSSPYDTNFDRADQFVDKINLEQSIAAVFNKVAYGSTTKRSIPDTAAAYPVTTLATPLLTTYRYSDGNDEYFRVDVKHNGGGGGGGGGEMTPGRDIGRSNYDYDQTADEDRLNSDNLDTSGGNGYGADLEKDHVLPTSAPAADILKNNNNRHYDNPNRYNNDRLKPSFDLGNGQDSATESIYKTTTSNQPLRNVRPTKSIYSKDVPSYVPPSRAFFTPPLPPEYLSPFADKPTLRGTNSDSYANRRPIPPPSIMPNKDRIPFRPDMPNKVINVDRTIIDKQQLLPNTDQSPMNPNGKHHPYPESPSLTEPKQHQLSERKKTLNTPSQSVNIDRLGEFYGLNRNHNDSSTNSFEYEKSYNIPSITRILSGSNGRSDSISEILLRTVTATPPPQQRREEPTAGGGGGGGAASSRGGKPTRTASVPTTLDADQPRNSPKIQTPEAKVPETSERVVKDNVRDEGGGGGGGSTEKEVLHSATGNTGNPLHPPPLDRSESVTNRKETNNNNNNFDLTTQSSEYVNLPNVKQKKANVTLATSEEIWFISWNVHVYLVVLCYVVLALFSIYKLIRYENDPHMFSKSYFLTIHLMLTVICVLRIFYLTYDPYNVDKSFNIFLYDFLHNFPLSLLATTFAVLILFLLKRTLTHLKVKTRPVFLVVFGLIHILLCFFLSIFETLGHFDRAGLIVCKPVFVLLAWALGVSYLYLYKIIKNVLAKKSQNLSEMCTQNIGYASHITIAVALLFLVLGCVQLYALFCIKVDRFNGEIKHHWILWGFELSVRLLEISIITLLAIVVSLKLSQREKQTVGFPLFPCTTSESSSDNIYPNNCNTNPNALNYSRNEMIMENLPSEPVERPNLLKNTFQNDSFEKKSTLERYPATADGEARVTVGGGANFERFERPKWGSDRFESFRGVESASAAAGAATTGAAAAAGAAAPTATVLNNFDRVQQSNTSGRSGGGVGGSGRKSYDTASKYYVKPKYDVEYNNEDYQHDGGYPTSHHHQNSSSSSTHTHPSSSTALATDTGSNNVYAEPLDTNTNNHPANHQYERTRHEFERTDLERRSRNSSSGGTNSGRRSTTGRPRKQQQQQQQQHAHTAGGGGGGAAAAQGHHAGEGRSGAGVRQHQHLHHQHHLGGMQTLPGLMGRDRERDREREAGGREETMLVDDQGFLRFRHMQDLEYNDRSKRSHKQRPSMNDVNHYSDA